LSAYSVAYTLLALAILLLEFKTFTMLGVLYEVRKQPLFWTYHVSVRSSVYYIISETKGFVGFSRNSLYKYFTKCFLSRVGLVKIGSETVTLY
jgi:hypothetical protein